MRNQLLALAAAAVLMGSGGGAVPRVFAADGAPAGAGAPAEKKLTAAQIQALIAKLGAEDFKTREAAHNDLVAAGPAALPALEKAALSGDAEAARQAQGAIQDIRRLQAAAASAVITQQHQWCYPIEKGPAWPNGCAWPVIYGPTGYLVGQDSKLHALYLKTGKECWTADLAANGLMGPANASAGEKYVSVLMQKELTVFDAREGKQLWRKDLKAANGGAAAPGKPGGNNAAGMAPVWFMQDYAWVVGDQVVVRTGDAIRAYHAPNGQDAWKMDVPNGNGPRTMIVEDAVAYVSTGQAVEALDLATQKELWKQDLPGCIKLLRGGPACVCFAPTKLVALDAKKGQKLWQADLPAGAGAANGRPVSPMILAGKTLADDTRAYILLGETLLTFELRNGKQAAATFDVNPENPPAAPAAPDPAIAANRRPMITQMAAAAGTFYGVTAGQLIAFDPPSGARLWMLPLKYNLPTEPVIAAGVLYFATTGQQASGLASGLPPAQPAPDAPADSPIQQPGLHAVKLVQ